MNRKNRIYFSLSFFLHLVCVCLCVLVSVFFQFVVVVCGADDVALSYVLTRPKHLFPFANIYGPWIYLLNFSFFFALLKSVSACACVAVCMEENGSYTISWLLNRGRNKIYGRPLSFFFSIRCYCYVVVVILIVLRIESHQTRW